METEKSTATEDTTVNVSTTGQSQQSPDLRIVLIGGRELTGGPSNKSEAGNIILGKKVFDTSKRTAQSSASQQEVHGRQVTVVDTPGWWWHYPRENTPKLDQLEIQNSVHLCPPGPHAFLLVIPVDLIFPEIFKQSLEEHLSLINKGVFDHTIVLFTTERPLSYQILQNVIASRPALQVILEACGNRKHVFVISNRHDTSQVRILLKKIDLMVAENAGSHFCINLAEGNALRVKMETIVEGASKRFHKVQTRRRKLRALIEDGKTPPTHLRIVMVGAQWSAKSSAGNTILRKQAFPVCHRRTTEYCEKSHSMVADRKLTLVDSPGWYYNSTLQDLRQMDRLEIENSVHLCAPGPHAVLLVVGLASAINTSYWKAMLEHMSLFTDEVWNHTIVLFTRGEWLGMKTVEERIESESGLRWLMEKCGNRYHVLYEDSCDKTQVTELLEKIEEMWAGNKSPYYEVTPVRAEELEARKEVGLKLAKRMKQITQRQERILRQMFAGETTPIRDMKLVLVGKKESGKSMAGNRILSQELFDSAWGKKEFQNQQMYTMCVKHELQKAGLNISVVEAPGWLPDMMITDWLKKEIRHGVSMCAPGPHIFLLTVAMSKTFTEDDYQSMVQMLESLGEKVWRHCMVLFTWGDWLNNSSIEEHIVAEGKALKQLVEKCGNRYYAVSPSRFGDGFPITELFKKMIDLMKRNNGQCFTVGGKQGQGKKPPSWQEEWSRREQELIDRMMTALAQEPEEPPVKPERKIASIDGAFIPSLKIESVSDSESTFWIGRIRARVSEWLNLRVGNSISSGVESMSACTSHMDNLNDYLLADSPSYSRNDERALARVLHCRVSTDTADSRRRFSL